MYLYSHGVESVEDPDAVGHVALQSASADNHVPHRRCVSGTDVRLTGKWRHSQDLVARNRQRRLHAAETPIDVILEVKERIGHWQHFSSRELCDTLILLYLTIEKKRWTFILKDMQV